MVPYETIKNWTKGQRKFRDMTSTLRNHDVSRMNYNFFYLNILILGKVSSKRISNGEFKAMHELKLGGQEG